MLSGRIYMAGKFLILMTFTLIFLLRAANAMDFVLGVQDRGADVTSYEILVLRLALKHADGNHKLSVKPFVGMAQGRLLRKLVLNDGSFNVVFSGYSRKREKDLLQVNIPLSRGLLGYRLFVIREENQTFFSTVDTLSDLRDMVTVGSGVSWPDTVVFQTNGFETVTAKYSNLWEMLNRKRFMGFNRGLLEVFIEMPQVGEKYPKLKVEEELIVAYPFDYFLYVNKNNKEAHDILYQGIVRAYESGEYMENFFSNKIVKQAIEKAEISSRRVIKLENANLSAAVKAIPAKYWHQF